MIVTYEYELVFLESTAWNPSMSWWFFIRNFEYKFFLTQGTNLGNVNRLVLGKRMGLYKGK